ncbi:UNVERIFIED_CONTAM: hypothetical protein HDU68_001116 [Siphonaria sp. JEL0065]|nr:hypothetical protein HDU68_001116 [Siphonaria sp. JEL0065]
MPIFSPPPKELKIERFESVTKAVTIDLVTGFFTSALVAPIVATIDKCIIANASGREPLEMGLRRFGRMLVTNPIQFARQPFFFPVFCIFAGTYGVANVVETVCIVNQTPPALPKFVTSSGINIVLCAWKDSLFTQWYGVVNPKPLPKLSLALFGLRDSMTVGTSFIAPPLVSPLLQSSPFNIPKKSADLSSQIILPCLVQFVSTPVHLVSLDLYNHAGFGVKEHWAMVKKNYWKSAIGRVCRTLPGFGFGGIANRHMRVELNHWANNCVCAKKCDHIH